MERKILVCILTVALAALVGAGSEPVFSYVLPGMSKLGYQDRLMSCAIWAVFVSTSVISAGLRLQLRPLILGLSGIAPAALYYGLMILAKSSVLLPFTVIGCATFLALGLFVSLIHVALWAIFLNQPQKPTAVEE